MRAETVMIRRWITQWADLLRASDAVLG